MKISQELLFSKTFVSDLPLQRKCDLLNTLWPCLQLTPDSYIETYYVDFWDAINRTLTDLHGSTYQFAAQDLAGLLHIVTQLNQYRALPKADLIEKIKDEYLGFEEDHVVRSVELVARFWLGIHISTPPKWLSIGTKDPRDTPIGWDSHDSLTKTMAGSFTRNSARPYNEDYIFDDSFTAEALQRICRLSIRWTDNLADHLKLEGSRGDRVLSVYYHKICLVNHRDKISPAIIDEVIVREALRTLDLLFPIGDTKTAKFLEDEGKHFYSVSPAKQPRPTDLSEFPYWRSHLAQLLKLLNGPPETVTQTLLDTRNTSQFATLWVAIFGVFTLTIIFGMLTTVYSIKQYEVAVKSYHLSVAVACAEHSELRYCQREL